MKAGQKLFLAALLASVMSLGGQGLAAETKPEGEMRFALYVTLAPAWLDPGEAVLGNLTPFWMLYALHDALVKPMLLLTGKARSQPHDARPVFRRTEHYEVPDGAVLERLLGDGSSR